MQSENQESEQTKQEMKTKQKRRKIITSYCPICHMPLNDAHNCSGICCAEIDGIRNCRNISAHSKDFASTAKARNILRLIDGKSPRSNLIHQENATLQQKINHTTESLVKLEEKYHSLKDKNDSLKKKYDSLKILKFMWAQGKHYLDDGISHHSNEQHANNGTKSIPTTSASNECCNQNSPDYSSLHWPNNEDSN